MLNPQYNNLLFMCILSFKVLAMIVPVKTVTPKILRSYVIMKLWTDQIQYSPTFSKRGYNELSIFLYKNIKIFS